MLIPESEAIFLSQERLNNRKVKYHVVREDALSIALEVEIRWPGIVASTRKVAW